MIYSYTQLSHYLACPRKYRYRYVDGWQEKETRAGLLFGRAFEQALGAYFHRQDASEVLYQKWAAYQNATLDYAHGDSWDRMLEQGTKLLELFAQQDRVEIRCPKRNLQIKVSRPLSAALTVIPDDKVRALRQIELRRPFAAASHRDDRCWRRGDLI